MPPSGATTGRSKPDFWMRQVSSVVRYRMGGLETARRYHKQALSLCRELGDTRGDANVLLQW